MTANIDRFNGLAAIYDAVRPQLPPAALDVLCEMAGTDQPALVVDLGSGTGLSSRAWIGRARRIVGVEPNDGMRRQAYSATRPGAVEYVAAMAEDTGLPDACADLVTVGQALHWMDRMRTFKEAARCLREGGVFATYDCDWPPFVAWQLVSAWRELSATAERVIARDGLAPGLNQRDKAGHLERMRESGCFRVTMELCFHMRTSGDGARLVKLAKSHGGLATALKAESAEAQQALALFSERVTSVLGDRVVPWTYTYRMRVGVK